MTALDNIIVLAYFAVVFGIGAYFFQRAKTSKSYFLADRSVGWIAVGASLFASNISSEHFIGLAGSGASSGLAVGSFEWLAVFMCMTLAWVFVPFYLRSGVYTMPEFLERRYGPACRWYLTTVSVIAYVVTKISVSLYAGALVLKAVAGWDFITSATVMVVATGVYTIFGGLAAVIYTELLQAVVLLAGAATLTILGLVEAGGMAGVRAAVPPDFFHMIKPSSDPAFPWTGIFFGAPILGVWYWCTDQMIVQRVLSARDEGHAKAGTIFAGFLKILPVFMLVLPGIIAFALFPEQVKKPDFAYPTLVLNLLPVGLVGLVMAALLAAVMGAMSSVFNSASTLVTLDFYKKLRPQASERQLVNFGRIATGVMVVLGILWVPFIHLISSQLYIYMQSVQAYISPPIAACFIFGILWPRLNGAGAIASLLTGFVLGAARFVLESMDKVGGGHHFTSPAIRAMLDLNFLHYAIVMFVICSAVLMLVSLTRPAPEPRKIAGLTFATVNLKVDTSQMDPVLLRAQYKPAPETPLERRINIAMSLLLVATVVGLWI